MDPFSKFFYQQIRENILYVYTQGLPPDLQYVTILPCESWKSKNITDFDSILSKLLTCSWGHFEHLIYHLTVVRQTVSRLLTYKTDDIQDWWHTRLLILSDWWTFWSLSDDVSNKQLNVVQLNVVASWWFFYYDYLHTIFVLSTLYFMCYTHI